MLRAKRYALLCWGWFRRLTLVGLAYALTSSVTGFYMESVGFSPTQSAWIGVIIGQIVMLLLAHRLCRRRIKTVQLIGGQAQAKLAFELARVLTK